MAIAQCNERDQYPVRITLRDADNNLVAPSTLRYRYDCVTTQTEVIAWTVIGASSVVNLTIPSSANAIINPANETEVKRLRVQANYGTNSQINTSFDLEVTNDEFYS